MALTLAQGKNLLVETWKEFSEDQAPRLGAALAYYTVLSLAPLMILLIAVAGLVFGKEAAQGQLFDEITAMVGPQGAEAIQSMIAGASKPSSGVIASIIGFLTLIFGASSVAGELKAALNIIWDRPADSGEGVAGMVKQRSKALGVVLGCGFLLLVSLAVSSTIAAAGGALANLLPLPEVILHLLTFVLSVLVITGVFAVLFKYLPDVDVQWSDVFIGAAFTAVLFTIGKFLIGMYLGKASFGSSYGAAGSLVIVLVWVYYSAQLFFFGAEFTQVYAGQHGSDPAQKRKEAEAGNATPKATAAGKPKQQSKETPAPAYAQSVGQQTMTPQGSMSGPAAATGSLLGSALAITRIVQLFRKGR